MKFKVYTLTDPLDSSIKYVGSTQNPLWRRLASHMWIDERQMRDNPRKSHWIIGLKSLGLKPEISIIDSTEDKSELLMLEKYWTYQLRAWGFDLLNRAIGQSHCLDTRIKQSEIKKAITYKQTFYLAASEKRRQPVWQLDKGNNPIKMWASIISASKTLKIDRSDITRCCKGRAKLAGGFKWEYTTKEEYEKYQHFAELYINPNTSTI